MKTSLLTGIIALLFCNFVTAQHTQRNLTAANGTFIGFYEFKPAAYSTNPTEKFPLIVFMHGMGERGNGTTELSRVLANAIPKYINNGHPMKFTWNGREESFLVLSPQLSNSWGFWPSFYAEEMIQYAIQNLRVDTNRIYVTGLSLGGGGTWQYATSSLANARKAAAVVPVCGTCSIQTASYIASASLPVWAFHASNDGTVSAGCTTGGVSTINSFNPPVPPIMTIYPDGGHGIWDRAYDTNYSWQNPNVYEWMLGQNKSLAINQRPVANAGPALTISTSKAFVNLSGSASTDADGTIVRYVWRKVSGPAAGTIITPVSTNGYTTISNLTTAGTYVYELKAIDNRAGWSVSTVTVTVISGVAANIQPIANAGPDISTTVTTVLLNGSASYDPDGNSVTYSWSKIAGPGQYAISNSTTATPTIYNLANGTYQFELLLTDNTGAIDRDTVTIQENFVILPEFFRSASARQVSDKIIVTWKTVQENPGSVYSIERSTDGRRFSNIGTVKSENQLIAEKTYEFSDQPGAGLYYYRIAARSEGSDVQYSALLPVQVQGRDGGLQLFPNPARDEVTLRLPAQSGKNLTIRILNSEGKQVYQHKVTAADNASLLRLPVQGLLPGIYLVMVNNENAMTGFQKLVKY